MADVAEGLVPPSALDQKGNTTIWWVPTIADVTAPKAATEIGAAGAFRVTYSFTPGGFKFAGSQGTTKDERLGLVQALESLDTNDVTLELEYVESADAGSANCRPRADRAGDDEDRVLRDPHVHPELDARGGGAEGAV
jgi:hypothetical protein